MLKICFQEHKIPFPWFFDHFEITMSDRLNPIFVYEIRQAVRNRLILASLCVYVALAAAVVGWHFYAALAAGRPLGYDGDGKTLLYSLLRLLGVFSTATVAIYSVAMTIRQGLEEELLYMTRLDWYRTACGKMQVAALLMLLFYAATLPMLTLAWMMRGVDLINVTAFLSVMLVVTLSLTYYLVAAVIRCRNEIDVAVAAAGMAFALPPWLVVFAVVKQLAWGMTYHGAGVAASDWAGALKFLLIILVPLALTTMFSGEMFKTNWLHRTRLRRFARVAAAVWFSVLLSSMGTPLCMLVVSIAQEIVKAVFGG